MAFLGQFFVQELVKIAVKEVVEAAVVTTVVATTAYVGVKTVEGIRDMVGKESSSSSSITTCFPLEQKTIYDWWGHGLTDEEYQKLLELGYNIRTECFSLEEVKTMIRCEVKAPGKPPVNAPGWERKWEPPKGWNGELKRPNDKSKAKGYPHKDGSVWVPTGENPNNPNSHGGPHWDVEYPSGHYGDYENVFPDGTVRRGRK
ncbi:polymorphic toxin type 37 domain-containing protein [endosymbiont GvMRE of Glomus versiforme]|uniref:polymorphic toxin type 37 domain-containing protein n=1 Tax=endosymbiont GvMRE of Glomus versiforme TaxID=2039283 RepID=UPI000ECEEB65|nr:hypothetical protein [endosymbiont GvMRE of Glomus versiforme]RHZ35588.1 Colicin D family protein [endosymbiont GvMRE of Glomus versiforme]